MTETANFSVGTMVKARNREWVVLPGSDDTWLQLRPIGGSDLENTAIYLPLEHVESASFHLPDISKPGDNSSASLLREAIRLGFRSSAGPFRSSAHLSFEPRPYQLVPLLMALRQDTIRILIADDVGIGKTVEAGLIARELLDRGEIQRIAVLCPPPLAEQWQSELREKFHIDAELVLASTAARLERSLNQSESIFDHYPFVIVSLDYIKSERRRDEFIRACPECVIVDEAHCCAMAQFRSGQQQRYNLIRALSEKAERHMILVTATPHSGKEDAFRSLIGLLNHEFEDIPEDLEKSANQKQRQQLAQYFVQRRRADIRSYMREDTPFPTREEKEISYDLSKEYAQLFQNVLEYVREIVKDKGDGSFKQRVRWWSALALLRSISSSPAAAAETLRNRAVTSETENLQEIDRFGQESIMDFNDNETLENLDVPLGADFSQQDASDPQAGTEARLSSQKLRAMAKAADELRGAKDQKLQTIIPLVKELLKEGYNPILFCRFIPTAEYLAEQLREEPAFRDCAIIAVTGSLPPAERVERIDQLASSARRILIATDCLSEGINLQENFNAVIHYDLSWNPTRHEQREGRVDRYGQPSSTIRIITYYSPSTQIDGVILNVLLKKHKAIHSALGVSVPIPVNGDKVVEAVLEGLLLSNRTIDTARQDFLPGFEPKQKAILMREWDNVTEREKKSRTIFAQNSIRTEEVAAELKAMREAIGSGVSFTDFCENALTLNQCVVEKRSEKSIQVDFSYASEILCDGLEYALNQATLKKKGSLKFRFELPLQRDELLLTRTHPFVETLANYVLETALDEQSGDQSQSRYARRCGVVRTSEVSTRTTLLVLRYRYHLLSGQRARALLAEECALAAFRGRPSDPVWLSDEEAEQLLNVRASGNVLPEQIQQALSIVSQGYPLLSGKLQAMAQTRAQALLSAHQRVRPGKKASVEPQLPPDVLGFYVYLP